MVALVAEVEMQKEVALGDPVVGVFRLRNTGDTDIYVLKWFSPLEGFYSDCLMVRRGEESIPYDGFLAKRVRPVRASYILIKAAQEVSVRFELDKAYSIAVPGEYSVRLKSLIWDILPTSLDVATAKVSGFYDLFEQGVYLESTESTFVVTDGDRAPRRTIGSVMRLEFARNISFAPATPQVPKLIGGSATERDAVISAHSGSFALCKDAIASLPGSSARFKKWFGNSSSNIVRGVLDAILDGMVNVQFTYDLRGFGCPDAHAITCKGCSAIRICDLFWGDHPTGANSQRSTILHEHSHASAYTDDVRWSIDQCLDLATTDPGSCVRNAASYEFYGENV